MRRRATILILPVLALLAGCEFRPKSGDEAPDAVANAAAPQIEEGLTIDTQLFEGKLNLPGMSLGDGMDLDGIKLEPGSKVVGINVDARHEGKASEVRIGFTSDAPPPAVLDHYRKSASEAGYKLDAAATDATLSGTKGDNRFALTLAGNGPGTTGTIVMTGS